MTKSISILLPMATVFCAAIFFTGCQSNQPAPAVAAPVAKPVVVQSAPLVVTVAAPVAYRVKAGLTAPFTDSEGKVWLSDSGFDGGDVIERDLSTPIANTKDAALFLSEHYSMNSFSCKIADGKYTAKLYFCETFDGITGPGQRVFSFNVQGREFRDFDVWVKAGGLNHAYVESVPVAVTNGVFRIDFTSNIENPQINAIELLPLP